MNESESNPLCDGDPLARALAKLRPLPASIDTPQLLFQAGQSARDRAVRFWKRAFLTQAGALVVVVGIFSWNLLGSAERGLSDGPAAHKIEYIQRPMTPEEAPLPRTAPDEPSSPITPPLGEFASQPTELDRLAEYVRVRREVLTGGLGLLPDSKPRVAPPTNPADLERDLNLPRGVLTAPYGIPQKPTQPKFPE